MSVVVIPRRQRSDHGAGHTRQATVTDGPVEHAEPCPSRVDPSNTVVPLVTKRDEEREGEDESAGEADSDEDKTEPLPGGHSTDEFLLSADPVRIYLNQIGKVALLNAEEEVTLAKRIEAGLYAAQRMQVIEDSTEKLSPQLRRDLRWIVRDGERAKDHLLEANLRLVVSMAKRYTGCGMPFLDLIQEGNLGLTVRIRLRRRRVAV